MEVQLFSVNATDFSPQVYHIINPKVEEEIVLTRNYA